MTSGGVMELPKIQPKMIFCWYIVITKSLLGVTLKYKIDVLIDKLSNTLNKLMINRNDLLVETIKTIETTIETLKM